MCDYKNSTIKKIYIIVNNINKMYKETERGVWEATTQTEASSLGMLGEWFWGSWSLSMSIYLIVIITIIIIIIIIIVIITIIIIIIVIIIIVTDAGKVVV